MLKMEEQSLTKKYEEVYKAVRGMELSMRLMAENIKEIKSTLNLLKDKIEEKGANWRTH